METPVKRSVVIAGRRTSVSLEDDFWKGLKEIAFVRHVTLAELMTDINSRRTSNLSSAIRLFVLNHYRAMAPPAWPNNRADTRRFR